MIRYLILILSMCFLMSCDDGYSYKVTTVLPNGEVREWTDCTNVWCYDKQCIRFFPNGNEDDKVYTCLPYVAERTSKH